MLVSPDPLSLFLAAARANEQRPAVIEANRTWTYAELAGLAARVAEGILRCGVEKPRVAINLDQGVAAYAAMFGTLIAGGCYCPLNSSHPEMRRARIIALFEPHVLVANRAADLDGLGVSAGVPIVECANLEPLSDEVTPRPADTLAYVMFTSGSTGEPKGVMVGRAGLGHYVAWAQRAMQLTPRDRWSQHPNIAFDLSVLDIYAALCSGAALVPIKGTRFRIAPALAIREYALTIWNSVPSVMDLMIKAGHVTPEMMSSLRVMTFCGEPLLREHVEAIFAARPDLTVHNTYGPTEATVSCTLARLDPATVAERSRPSVTLGVPIEGMHIDLDGAEPDEGEIVISGPQVAFGYWRRPDLTEAAFDITPERRSYRTGDWGKRVNGELYFLARTDRQVKRMGYRIELGDIDAAVRMATGSAACTVHVQRRLYTFVEATAIAVEDVMQKLAAQLPPYMRPDELRCIPMLPRSANDKIDVKTLERIVESGS